MRPSVTGYLMALSDHTLDDIRPACSCIDGTLADIDTSDKECSLEAVLVELIKNPVSINVWAIIVGDSNSASLLASVNTTSSVRNIALLRASIIASASTTRSLVGVASWAKIDETVRSTAVVLGCPTVSLKLC